MSSSANFEYLFCFFPLYTPVQRKQRQIFDIQNSTHPNRSAAEDIINAKKIERMSELFTKSLNILILVDRIISLNSLLISRSKTVRTPS